MAIIFSDCLVQFKMKLKFNRLLSLIKESLIKEGGASGHMTHLFEDGTLTFGDVKQIFKDLFSGKIYVEEKCLAPNSKVILKNNGEKTIEEVVNNKIDDEILSYNEYLDIPEFRKIIDYSKNGVDDQWLKITLSNGKTLICTPNHRIFLLEKNIDVKAEELKIGDDLIVND